MAPRAVGAIALRPAGNIQRGYYFMSLLLGRILNRFHATPLPMPAEVAERVHALAEAQEAHPESVFGVHDNCILVIVFDHNDSDEDDYVESTSDSELSSSKELDLVPTSEDKQYEDGIIGKAQKTNTNDEDIIMESEGSVLPADSKSNDDQEHVSDDEQSNHVPDDASNVTTNQGVADGENQGVDNMNKDGTNTPNHGPQPPEGPPDDQDDLVSAAMDARYGQSTTQYNLQG